MTGRQLHIIPKIDNLKKSLEICDRWGTAFEYNDFFNPSLLNDRDALTERVRKYKELKRPAGTDTLHGVFFDICIHSSDPEIAEISRRRMISSMDTASELGCRGVVFHTNLIPGFEPDFYLKNWLDTQADFYSQLASRYSGIEIWMENMFDFKPDMLVKFGERTADINNVGVCYDVAHGHLWDVPMEEWVKGLGPFIRHLHINDNDRHGDQHLPVGDGTIDWDGYFKLIDRYAPDASILVEVSDLQDAEKSLHFLKDRGYI